MKINRKKMETQKWVRRQLIRYDYRLQYCNSLIRWAKPGLHPSYREREEAMYAEKEIEVIYRRIAILEKIAQKIGMEIPS